MKQELSKCCKASVTTVGAIEGTAYWKCSKCDLACDLFGAVKDSKEKNSWFRNAVYKEYGMNAFSEDVMEFFESLLSEQDRYKGKLKREWYMQGVREERERILQNINMSKNSIEDKRKQIEEILSNYLVVIKGDDGGITVSYLGAAEAILSLFKEPVVPEGINRHTRHCINCNFCLDCQRHEKEFEVVNQDNLVVKKLSSNWEEEFDKEFTLWATGKEKIKKFISTLLAEEEHEAYEKGYQDATKRYRAREVELLFQQKEEIREKIEDLKYGEHIEGTWAKAGYKKALDDILALLTK